MRSAVSFTRDAGVAAVAVKEMLSALGADVYGGSEGKEETEEEEERWCLASDVRRRFLSRLLSSLVISSWSLLTDDADVCWAALEIEAAVARGEREEEEGNINQTRSHRNWPRARAAAKAFLARAAAQGATAAGLWRAYARLQAVSGSTSSSSSLKVTTALLAALASQPERRADAERHALAAAVEAADNSILRGSRGGGNENALAMLLVAAACGAAPSDVAVGSNGEPTEEARAAALSSLERTAAASEGEAAAAAAAAEALLLLLPRPASALAVAEAEAVAGLAQAAEKLFGFSDAPSSSSSSILQQHRHHHRRRRDFAWVVLRRCRLLAASAERAAAAVAATASTSNPASASASVAGAAAAAAAAAAEEAARSAILGAMARFPEEPAELVDLLADLPFSAAGAAASDDEKSLQLLRDVVSRAPSPPALLRALSRASLSGTAAVASAIEHVVRRSEGPLERASPRLFRALARAEIAAAASGEEGATTLIVSRARRALLRGLSACPWSLDLHLDLVDPAALAATGCDGANTGARPAPLLLLVPSGERAQLLGAAADAGVLLGARVDVYETALAVAAEGIVGGEE